MAPTTSNATGSVARERPRRAPPTILKQGVGEGAKLFRSLFPGVSNKKVKGWKFNPDAGYRLVNDLRKRHGDAIPRDRRLDNALSHRATANAREMASREGAAAAAAVPIVAPIYMYKPEELAAALAGGHTDDLARTLTIVNSEEGAEVMVRQGYQRFSCVNQYDTLNSGLSQLPPDDETGIGRAACGRPSPVPAHKLPAPAGEIRLLPKKMPEIYKPGPNEPSRLVVDIVVECFEEKVIDVAGKRTWHPICSWPLEARERKKLGYDDPAGLNNRVKAYFAIKSGAYSRAELKDKKFAELVAMAVAAKTSTGDTGTYFALAKRLFDSQNV